MESLWNDHPAQFARVGTRLGPGLWEVREVPTSPLELTQSSEDEGVDPPVHSTVQDYRESWNNTGRAWLKREPRLPIERT